jgi:RNA polymerase sigma-32 factor
MATPRVPTLTAEGNLSRYLQEIRKFPMLEANEEYMLGKRWREHEDSEAAHRLVTSHLRLVAKIAMGYRGYGLPINEIISEGNVGLMQAVKRFEPERGFRLATYAMWVAGQDRHHGGAEEAVLQPAQGQRPVEGL